MSKNITRREFLKLAGAGAAAWTAWTVSGPVFRSAGPQTCHPPGTPPSTPGGLYATTCGECPAGCGLLVHTLAGCVCKIEGNPAHPVNAGHLCARAQAALPALYHPQRIQNPGHQTRRGSGSFQPVSWEAAIEVLAGALHEPREVVFLLGMFPDHLHDLVKNLTVALGGGNVLRFSLLSELEGRLTLMDAAQKLFGIAKIPTFDIAGAEVVFSFGADFTENWFSPAAGRQAYERLRARGGSLVQFEPRRSATAAAADEWIPVLPGSEGRVAQAIGRWITDPRVSLTAAAHASGMTEATLARLAHRFAAARRKVAIPGGAALGHADGLASAQAILALNLPVQDGNLAFMPDFAIHPETPGRPASLAEMQALIDRMQAGRVRVLFVHGSDPLAALPKTLGFARAMQQVPLVISFSPWLNETVLQADYVFPDHSPLESQGYQKVATAADRPTFSGLQPVTAPLYNTRPTAEILLAAARRSGRSAGQDIQYTSETDFIQKAILPLLEQDGTYQAGSLPEFWAYWQQSGGWWQKNAAVETPKPLHTPPTLLSDAEFSSATEEATYFLMPRLHASLKDGSPPRVSCLPEVPGPVPLEMHPQAIRRSGLHAAETVLLSSSAGEIEAVVHACSTIHPQVVSIPLAYASLLLGCYAVDPGDTPLDLLEKYQVESGVLAFMANRVKITPGAHRRPSGASESRL